MLDRISKIPFKFRIIVHILIIGIVVGGYYYYSYDPKIKEIENLTKQYDQLSIKVAQLKPIELSYDKFKEEVEILDKQFQKVLQILPDEKSFNVIYDQVVGLAEKNGVRVSLFQPKGESKVDEFHSKTNFSMNFDTSYLELINFLYRLNYLDKIVNVNSISIKTVKTKEGTIGLGVSSNMNSYRFNVSKGSGGGGK